MLSKYYTAHLIAMIVIFLIAINFGGHYSSSDIKDILSTLQNISAMIFTIAGIWLAYIYPKAIAGIMKPSTAKDKEVFTTTLDNGDIVSVKSQNTISEEDKKSAQKDIDRITMIVEAIITSAIVILIIVMGNVIKPLLYSFNTKESLSVISKIGCFISLSLVYFQIVSLMSIIISNLVFVNDIHNEKNNKELDELK